MNADSNGTMLHVREAGLLNWVEVDVDNFVKVSSDDLGLLVKILEVVNGVAFVVLANESRKGKRGQVADSDFVLRTVLDNLGT